MGVWPSNGRSPVPLVERVVTWSTRHRTRAMVGWLLLVVIAVVVSGVLPGDGARARDPGEGGQAQQVLRSQPSYEPSRENVLIQSRNSGGAAFADDPALRDATKDLMTALRQTGAVTGLRSPLDAPEQLSPRTAVPAWSASSWPGPNDQMTAHYEGAVATIDTVADRNISTSGWPRPATAASSVAVDQAVQDDFSRCGTSSRCR